VIEGLMAQVTLEDDLSLGVAWSLRTHIKLNGWPFERGGNLTGEMGQNPSDMPTTPTTSTTPLSGSGFTFVGTDPSGIVRAFLQALVIKSRAKLLATPHILVADNREASIQVGSQIPIATSTISTAEIVTGAITTSVQYKDIGIILKVKPQINESGLVSLELSQEVSSLGGAVQIAGQSYSSITKTEAKTNLVSQDGQTIIIGGLIREDTSQSRSGIPFLSNIPILGYLFGKTSNTKTRNELIILLTPHVMKSPQEAKVVTSDYVDRFIKTTKEIKLEEFIKGKGK